MFYLYCSSSILSTCNDYCINDIYHPNHSHSVYGHVIGQISCNQHQKKSKNNQARNLYNYFFNKNSLKINLITLICALTDGNLSVYCERILSSPMTTLAVWVAMRVNIEITKFNDIGRIRLLNMSFWIYKSQL